jgi:hypothetical protein
MKRNPHPIGKSLVFATFGFLVLVPAFSQQASLLPAWLESYPGATPDVRSSGSVVESSYTAAAQPADIVEHYRKLFEAAGLPYQPNDDGIGTSIRAEARECDLLIQIRSRPEGAFVAVNCSAKTQTSSSSSPTDVQVIAIRPPSRRGATGLSPASAQPHLSTAELMEQHQKKVAELGIHREYHDAPAPLLIWPAWLVHISGGALRAERGVDQSKNAILKARYTTNVPMTEIYHFYRDLLNSHEYPARASLSTGQTMTGVVQNALGYVEGSNYPDGAPGAHTEIKVAFDRSVLNGPITVTLRFTTHEYIAKRGY